MGIKDNFQSFRETIDNTTASIRGVFWIGVIVVTVGLLILEWFTTLNTGQWVLLGIGLAFLFGIGVTYFLDWMRRKNIDNIPELLTKLDKLTVDHIDEFNTESDKPEMLLDDLSKLWNVDIVRLKTAAREKNQRAIGEELERINGKFGDYVARRKGGKDVLTNLLLIAGTLDDYNVGLARITDTTDYHNLYKRIRNLQKQVPIVDVNTKINEYFRWSYALYSVLLSTKPILNLVELKELIPIKIRANNHLIRNTVEDQTATLISAVRQSILEAKQRDKIIRNKAA